MNDDKQRVALVTGAASGIGAGIADHLIKAGWSVCGIDRDPIEIEGAHAIRADVARERDIQRAVRETLDRFGRLDALVSNAGLSEFGSLQECSLDDWNRILATNLTASFLFAREAEQALRHSRGAMVLTCSTRAHMSEPHTHAYSASKGGLLALTHSLAISLGPDVRVNCVSPGWINVQNADLDPKHHDQHPAGRVGQPSDIAGMVEYLLSPRAEFITGGEFVIDGGMTRKMIYS